MVGVKHVHFDHTNDQKSTEVGLCRQVFDDGYGRTPDQRELEKSMGVYLVALEPKYRLTELAEKQIKAREAELGLVLLAYTCD